MTNIESKKISIIYIAYLFSLQARCQEWVWRFWDSERDQLETQGIGRWETQGIGTLTLLFLDTACPTSPSSSSSISDMVEVSESGRSLQRRNNVVDNAHQSYADLHCSSLPGCQSTSDRIKVLSYFFADPIEFYRNTRFIVHTKWLFLTKIR